MKNFFYLTIFLPFIILFSCSNQNNYGTVSVNLNGFFAERTPGYQDEYEDLFTIDASIYGDYSANKILKGTKESLSNQTVVFSSIPAGVSVNIEILISDATGLVYTGKSDTIRITRPVNPVSITMKTVTPAESDPAITELADPVITGKYTVTTATTTSDPAEIKAGGEVKITAGTAVISAVTLSFEAQTDYEPEYIEWFLNDNKIDGFNCRNITLEALSNNFISTGNNTVKVRFTQAEEIRTSVFNFNLIFE